MELIKYTTTSDFLKENGAFLESAEVITSLMQGISLSNLTVENDQTIYLAIRKGSTIHFTCIKTTGRNLIVYGDPDSFKSYGHLLLQFIEEEKLEVPGIIGPADLSKLLAELIKSEKSRDYRVVYNQMIYALRKVEQLPSRTGKMRKAVIADHGFISEWFHAFLIEALGQDNKDYAISQARLKIENNEVFLWNDGSDVSMACSARPTQNGITLNYVYTPPAYRSMGYGTAVVKELSKKLKQDGYSFVTLFTDLANATSNSMYKKIGYQEVSPFSEISFIN